jgi:hypothetical protein
MAWPRDARFTIGTNADVLAFIERKQPSAHDDVASALMQSARGLSQVEWYCPDPHRYAYVVLHTRDNRIFGVAFGMSALAYRLPPGRIAEAVSEGGRVYAEIGDDWVAFEPWEGRDAAARLRRWCGVACAHARGVDLKHSDQS